MSEGDLLTVADVAQIYHVSTRTAREVVIRHPGFPKPIPASTKRNPVWLRERIEAYIRGDSTQK